MIHRQILFILLLTGFCFLFSKSVVLSGNGHFSFNDPFNRQVNNSVQHASLAGLTIVNDVPLKQNTIQVALLLDVSGSMNGLIEQAKSQLWDILNEFARTEREGEITQLEMALYTYGNGFSGNRGNYISQLVDFTTDMDMISEELFALATTGSEEYCGTVIKTSLDELSWAEDDGLKVIYIAGNESFNQGSISYQRACSLAKSKDVVVNTIYCGAYNEGVREAWKSGALAGGGDYFNIDQNKRTVYVETPYDDQIDQLNSRLNQTYIPYGNEGQEKLANQTRQDNNAKSYSKANSVDRATFKSSKKYKAESWDLVDAYEKDKSIIKKAKVVDESMKQLNETELEAKVKETAAERAKIKQEIQELDKKRRAYKTTKAKETKDKNLQNSIKESVKKQAKAKGYKEKNN